MQTVKLVKQLTKRPDQDWSGVWFRNADLKTSLNSKEDPRDVEPTNLTEEQLNVLKRHVGSNVRKALGYIGWDREYVSDDVLRIIYHFGTKDQAFGYLNGTWNMKNPELFAEYKNVMKANKDVHQYQGQWIFIDENGNEELIPTS